MDRPLHDDVRDKVTAALAAGHTIRAIALYRDATGVGLARAKEAVEAMGIATAVAPEPLHVAAIADALRAGRRIAAIKLYRHAYDVGLRDAKEAVDAMEADLRRSDPGRLPPARTTGPGRWSLLLALILLAVAALAAYLFIYR